MKIKKTYHTIIILLISSSLFLTACIQETDLTSYQTDNEFWIVEGQISNELIRHKVKITKSQAELSQAVPEPVSGLQLRIKSPDTTFLLKEEKTGEYYTDSLAGTPGTTYTLEIITDTHIIQAKDQMPALPTDFNTLELINRGDYFDFEFRRHQFGFQEPNLWKVEIIRDNITFDTSRLDPANLGQQIGVNVSNDFNYTFTYYTHNNIAVNGLLNFKIPHYFGFGYPFRIRQKKYNLSPEYYEFLRALFIETEWRGTLFPSNPENVVGNLDKGVLGYFSAVSVKSKEYSPE